jgi:4-diphosphocytidyl-2-C-methyl-D-erythritol kinase
MSGQPLGDPRPWPAPGKLNLFLHVTGRRPDGYHLLQTAFQFIDLADEIRFWDGRPASVEQIGEHRHVPPDLDLSLRAARLLLAHADVSRGVGIELTKRLPIQGGVGGGSSDAATVLVALNELWGTRWSAQALAELGLELGADVPVFIGGRAAWAEGIGERLTAVDFPEAWYVLIRRTRPSARRKSLKP